MYNPQTESCTPILYPDLGCFTKAHARGQATFTLVEQDQTAPDVIECWAEMNELALGKDHPKIVGARAMAKQWRQFAGKRQAD